MFFPEQFNFYHKELRFASYLSFFYFNFELMKRFFMSSAGFDILTAIKIQVVIFCVVMPCSVVVGYQRFTGPCCLLFPHKEV
jgi:hypothetical protein